MKYRYAYALAALMVASTANAQVVGSSSGVFQTPVPITAVTTGVGTNSMTFGTGAGSPPNQLTFTGSAFSSPLETPFKVGTLYFYNGAIVADTGITSIDLALTLAFSDPAIPNVTSAFTFNVVSTPNTGDADANADYLYFPSAFSTTTFLIGGTTYNVKLTGFGNIVGDGFLTSDSTQLHVRENLSATADLFAIVTTETAGVPEPATWAMMLLGFGGIGLTFRRGRKSNERLLQIV